MYAKFKGFKTMEAWIEKNHPSLYVCHRPKSLHCTPPKKKKVVLDITITFLIFIKILKFIF